jgi:hypothetical protein
LSGLFTFLDDEQIGKLLVFCLSNKLDYVVRYMESLGYFQCIDPIAVELLNPGRYTEAVEKLDQRLNPGNPLYLSPMTAEERFIINCEPSPWIVH